MGSYSRWGGDLYYFGGQFWDFIFSAKCEPITLVILNFLLFLSNIYYYVKLVPLDLGTVNFDMTDHRLENRNPNIF